MGLSDSLIAMVLSDPDLVVAGQKGRLIAQKQRVKGSFGDLPARLIYEQTNDKKVAVSRIGQGLKDTRRK